ncbi:MAG: hypothetical protein NTU88_15870, partial [Armatimonadetes bacterium]|nr:hypothetical protein [Armatimonadota bacterium]
MRTAAGERPAACEDWIARMRLSAAADEPGEADQTACENEHTRWLGHGPEFDVIYATHACAGA